MRKAQQFWMVVTSLLLIVLALVGGGITIRIASTSYLDRPANANVILAAALAFTGALVTAAVTLIGVFVKTSIDMRTTRIAEEANQRANVDQRRLQMQTAMEAVRLMSTSRGDSASVEQVSAALIVLSRLGETALAINLAAELWPKGHLSSSCAVTLCDDAITIADPTLNREAAILLANNWELLATGAGQAHWPSKLLSWPPELDQEARSIYGAILRKWLAKQPATREDDFRVLLLRSPDAPTAERSTTQSLVLTEGRVDGRGKRVE